MTWIDLADYRRRVATLYRDRDAALTAGEDPAAVAATWRRERDTLFARHPESALGPEARAAFHGLAYYAYDPAWCLPITTQPAERDERREVSGSHEVLPMVLAGTVHFTVAGADHALPLYWIDVYGGGLFLPFRDATTGSETYGGGRYLVDTVKSSDFIRDGDRIFLDFNYAYNPSCAYDYRWACPLAPPENRLPIPVRAGERSPHSQPLSR